jgi:hypothetical protein
MARGWNVIVIMRSPRPMLFEANDRLLVTALDVTDPISVSNTVRSLWTFTEATQGTWLALHSPMFEQRAGLAKDRVSSWQCKAPDVFISARAFAGFTVVHIHVLSRRVGPHYMTEKKSSIDFHKTIPPDNYIRPLNTCTYRSHRQGYLSY